MRRIFISTFLFFIVSCSSRKNSIYPIEIYKSEIPAVSVQNVSYVEPIINMSIKEASESRAKFYFIKYTKKSLDSILSKETRIFDFKQKVSLAANDELLKNIKLKLDSLIIQISKTKSIEDLTMPSEFSSLKDYGMENILLTYLEPKFSEKGGSFLSGSKRSGNHSQTIKSPGHRLDSAKTNFFVFNVLTDKLVLYTYIKKSKYINKQNFINYVKTILNTLENG